MNGDVTAAALLLQLVRPYCSNPRLPSAFDLAAIYLWAGLENRRRYRSIRSCSTICSRQQPRSSI